LHGSAGKHPAQGIIAISDSLGGQSLIAQDDHSALARDSWKIGGLGSLKGAVQYLQGMGEGR
jgi:hypothetical protein